MIKIVIYSCYSPWRKEAGLSLLRGVWGDPEEERRGDQAIFMMATHVSRFRCAPATTYITKWLHVNSDLVGSLKNPYSCSSIKLPALFTARLVNQIAIKISLKNVIIYRLALWKFKLPGQDIINSIARRLRWPWRRTPRGPSNFCDGHTWVSIQACLCHHPHYKMISCQFWLGRKSEKPL